jgi:hypothetical protein
MSEGDNVTLLPGGGRLVRSEDEAKVKAEALRLGILPEVSAVLKQHRGRPHVAAGIRQEGNRIVAIIAWAGFDAAADNGWMSLTATPACDKTASLLLKIAAELTNARRIQMVEGGSSWRS